MHSAFVLHFGWRKAVILQSYISIVYLSYMGDKTNIYKNLVGEPEESLGISRRR
jgi:S-ribosylhomocysteine lyase LuxS involved in autoinducer biosynthesis